MWLGVFYGMHPLPIISSLSKKHVYEFDQCNDIQVTNYDIWNINFKFSPSIVETYKYV